MATKTWVGDTGTVKGDWSDAANWSPSGVPTGGDDVYIPAGSYAISAGLNQSAVTLGKLIVASGYAQQIGTATDVVASYLQVGCASFEFDGSAVAYLDLGSSNISPRIFGTAAADSAGSGLYLKGSNLAALNVLGGSVGLAARPGETSTAATINVSAGTVRIGRGVTLTTLEVDQGTAYLACAATTVNLRGSGAIHTEATGAITTANIYSGSFFPGSSGTISTLNMYGGLCDEKTSSVARTITSVNFYPYQSIQYTLNAEAVTHTNRPLFNLSSQITVTPAG